MAVRTIATDIKLTGEKEFNDGMKSMNSNLKTLQTDMAAVSAEFADNATSVEALTAKQKVLQDTVGQHQAKVDALRQKYEAVKAAYGENSAQADKYKQQLNQATVALTKQQQALAKNAEALDNAKDAESEYTPVTQRMANAVKSAQSFVKELGKEFGDAAKKTPVLGEAIDIVTASTKALGTAAKGASVAVKGVGTVAAGAGKAGLGALGGLTKGVGAITAASVAGVAAIATGGVMIVSKLTGMAREAAEATKDIPTWQLTDSQKAWKAYADQLDALDSSVAGAKNALAGILLPALSELSAEGTAFLNDFSSAMAAAGSDTGAQTQVLSDYIVKGAKLIMTKLPEYAAAGKELFSGLAGSLAESGPELMEMGLDLITDLLMGIIEYAPQLAEAGIELVNNLTQSLIDRGPDLVTSAVGMVTQIVSGLAQAAPQMIPMAGQLIVTLITALVQAAPDLLIAGMELILGIISGITTGLGDIANAAGTIIETAKAAFSERASEILSLGKNIVEGIWDGISNGTEWIYGKIEGWVGSVLDWIKKKLGIASPSKVMRDEVGFWMARGIGEGFEQEMRNVNQLIASSLDTSFDVPDINVGHTRYRGRSYATSGGKTVNLYVSAKTLTESDINMLIDVVNRKLGDDL